MRLLLSIGNKVVETLLTESRAGYEVVDSTDTLQDLHDLLNYVEVDGIVINTLLDDEKGTNSINIAKRAASKGIKIIALVGNRDYETQKLISLLVNLGVTAICNISEITGEIVYSLFTNYPGRFDFSQLASNDENVPLGISIPVKKIERVGFKKLILTIWGNTEFGCELAYTAAKLTDYKVIVIDLNLKAPKAHIMLNTSISPKNITTEGIFKPSGLNIALNAVATKALTKDILEKAAVKRDLKNLYILTGNREFNKYEYYKEKHDTYLKSLIEEAYRHYDIVILLCEKDPYESFTLIPLSMSDYSLIAIKAIKHIVNEYNERIGFLDETQGIPIDRHKFISFDHSQYSLDESIIKKMVEGNYIGHVSKSNRRDKYQNKRNCYASRMEKQIEDQYRAILAYFNIVPKKKVREYIADMVKDLYIKVITTKKRLKSIKRRWGK